MHRDSPFRAATCNGLAQEDYRQELARAAAGKGLAEPAAV